jgi:hypothetical protein
MEASARSHQIRDRSDVIGVISSSVGGGLGLAARLQ